MRTASSFEWGAPTDKLVPVRSAAVALVGSFVLAGVASGCQEIVGIQPWDSAKGGAASTTASGTTTDGVTATTDATATTTVSGSGSSSSSGTPCLMNCLGGPCVDGVCGPYKKDIPDITSGFIRALPNQLVVATTAGALTWTLVAVDKFLAHDTAAITTAPSVRAISTTGADVVYFASADGIFLHRLGDTDLPLTDTTAKNVILAAGLERVDFNIGQELCWVHASDSPTAGGIYCQNPTMMVAPVQRAQFSYGGRLVSDGALVYSIQNVGTNGAGIVSTSTAPQMNVKAVPFASDLAVDDNYIYVLASVPQKLVAIDKADPTGAAVEQILAQTPARLVRFGTWLYVLFTSSGVIRRYEAKTLNPDPAFVVYTGGYPVDMAVDGDGIYWVGIGNESAIGIQALNNGL